MVPVNPQRILDSRTLAGWANVTNPTGSFQVNPTILAIATTE
jgi:hypothetical protein